MLVLSRKLNEKIVVDGPCTITVTQLRGRSVRLGIEAEKDVVVLRGEIAKEEGKDAGERRDPDG